MIGVTVEPSEATMTIVFVPDVHMASWAAMALSGVTHARVLADWTPFFNCAHAAARVAVLIVPGMDLQTRRRLSHLHWALGPVPIVTVTEHRLHSPSIWANSSITTAEARLRLAGLLDLLNADPLRQRLVALAMCSSTHSEVGRALRLTLEDGPPPRSVVELASKIFCDRTTLYRAWEKEAAWKRGVTLHRVLNAALAIRATELANKGRSRLYIANTLGIDSERTAMILGPAFVRSPEDPVRAACLAYWELIRPGPPKAD